MVDEKQDVTKAKGKVRDCALAMPVLFAAFLERITIQQLLGEEVGDWNGQSFDHAGAGH